MGPAHYGAALGRLIDRFYDAGLEEEGSNDARIRTANSLAHTAARAQEKTLPPPLGIELTVSGAKLSEPAIGFSRVISAEWLSIFQACVF